MEFIEINNKTYRLEEIESVGSGMPDIFSICLNFKSGKKVFIRLENKNAEGFALEINQTLNKLKSI